MRRLRKGLRWSRAEKGLFLEALFFLSMVRLGLWLLSFPRMLRFGAGGTVAGEARSGLALDVARAIVRAAPFVPRASCLTQALAGQRMLTRRGCAATVRFGGAKGADGFKAHAWLEVGGKTVLGGTVARDYSGFAP
jgi:hypothetical protein